MNDRAAESCPGREQIEALARGELEGRPKAEAIELLLTHAACRELYRRLTAGRFPSLPNYTIVEQVGRGGFGVVYRAIHETKQRVEALKILFGKTQLLASYFVNEVHLIARLAHPNIATLYEAQLETPPLYYAMEFIEGQRLSDYLRHHDVPLAQRLRIVRKVADAVNYAHQQGVVHRDLKPQNILMDADGEPHIVDFGIAKRVELSGQPAEGEARGGPVGTLGYIAPEQLAGRPVDARADIYALGALLFYCVTGEPVRYVRDVHRTLELLRQRSVSRPEDLAAIIARAVQEDPNERYPDCASLVEDLDNYLAGRPIHARPTTVGYELARLAGVVVRNHTAAVYAAIVAVVAAGVTATQWHLEAHTTWGPVRSANETVLIAWTPQTIQAIREGRIGADLPGLNVDDPLGRKSWRLLYGRLMEKLAEARPLVVAWDYYFPDCWPAHDQAFVRGVKALKAPVVVGVRDYDVNAEPELCDTLREVVAGHGSLAVVQPDRLSGEIEVILAIERGFETPVPGLALAAFAAVRFPQCRPIPAIDPQKRELEIRYRKRFAARREARFQDQTDRIPLQRIIDVRELKTEGGLLPDDRVATAVFPLHSNEYWDQRTYDFVDVLTADRRQLRLWFNGRAVVVGQMIPGVDEHALIDGQRTFGCRLHADALNGLLTPIHFTRVPAYTLALRNTLWSILAIALALILPIASRLSLSRLGWLCALLALGAALATALVAVKVQETWALEAWDVVCVFALAAPLAYWIRAYRQRQIELAPRVARLSADADGTTESSTVLAETL